MCECVYVCVCVCVCLRVCVCVNVRAKYLAGRSKEKQRGTPEDLFVLVYMYKCVYSQVRVIGAVYDWLLNVGPSIVDPKMKKTKRNL